MPYKLRKARNKDLYWVVDTAGNKYENNPIPLARAKKQIIALHIHTGHGMRGGNNEMKAKIEEAIQYISGRPTPEGITSRFMEIVGSPLFSHEAYAKNIEAYKQFYFKNAVIARNNFDDMEDAIRSYSPGHVFTLPELRHLKVQLTAILQQFSDKPKWQGGALNDNVAKAIELFDRGFHEDIVRMSLPLYMDNATAQEIESVIVQAKQIIAQRLQGGAMATIDILQKMAVQSYKPNASSVGNWDLIAETPTLKFFKNGDSFIVGIRGTHPTNFNDLKADASIAFNRLEYSQRYKIDKADLKKFIANNPGTYYGTGHSLGGAILDLFIREGMINEGISFNPAIQPRDYQSDSYLKNKRIYESCDPLYKTMGRFAKGSQSNTNAKGNILECHSLSNFDAITGGKKLKHIKKYLKGMGIPATKKNIDHAISACDSEGVAWD